LSTEPVAARSEAPSWAWSERSSARRGEMTRVPSWTETGRGSAVERTVTSRADTVPLAATRSQRAASTSDIRARTAASAATTPLSSSTFSSLTVRGTSARSTVPFTRTSTSGSDTGVRSVIDASTGSSPSAMWKRSRRTTVLSTSPPGLSTARSSEMSRAGSGRSGYRNIPSATCALSANDGKALPPTSPWTLPCTVKEPEV